MHLTPAEVGEYNINTNILDPNKKAHIFWKNIYNLFINEDRC